MNFCKWKTRNENPKDSFSVIYRLPLVNEWVAAYRFLTANKIPNDFNQNYSDWTLTTMDEACYDFNNNKKYFWGDYSYLAPPNDPKVLKRKLIIGNSFHHATPSPGYFTRLYFYEMDGRSFVSFRYLKRKIKPFTSLNREYIPRWYLDREVLIYWGLIQDKKHPHRYK